MTYAVPAGSIQKLAGSKDGAKLSLYKSKLAEGLQENDEFFEDMEDEEAEGEMKGCLAGILRLFVGKKKFEQEQAKARTSGPVPSSEQLLEAFINGDPIDLRCGSKMGYVLKMICELEGKSLEDAGLAGIRRGENWMKELDVAFAKHGVNLALGKLTFNQEEAFGVPSPDDFPGIGYLPLSLWEQNSSALASIDTSGVKIPSYLREDDEEEDEDEEDATPTDYTMLCIKTIQSWGAEAVAGRCDVVTFYH